MGIRVAVDIGGTFTDLVAVDEASGRVHVHKASSSPCAPIDAVRSVIAKAGLDTAAVSLFVHGTTVATNALIERDGTRVAFVTNRGFRDVLFIQDGTRRDLYSLEWQKPKPLVARYDCLEVGGRVDADGEVIAPIDDDDVAAVVAHLRAEGIRSVAIGMVFAQANPAHELELEERLRAEIPGLAISMSHRVFPRWRENDRWQTVVADAYLKAMFARYVSNLERGLEATGVASRLVLMKSNGGVVEAATAAEQPVNYLVSGPVGGVLGGSHFARQAGFDRIMTIDIGGTSSDVSLVAAGDIPRVARYQLDHGIPIKAPQIDITTIGAGGGSIGWVDAGGLLRVGPRSAGSTPGPACFGRGGTEPAIADANLVLGRLDPDTFCGGEIPLDAGLARAALHRVARPLGLSVEDAARAMLELATHDMVDALRVISIDRGIDARDFALVAIGGAGGLHGAEVARTLGIRTVIVPPYPGNTSAYGLLTAGLRSDLSTTLLVRVDDPSAAAMVDAALAPLRDRAVETLAREGATGAPVVEQRLEMRYLGQNHHREIPVAFSPPFGAGDLSAAVEAFHTDYELTYGYQQPWEHVEIVGAQVAASNPGQAPGLGRPGAGNGTGPARIRSVGFGADGFLDTPVLTRETLSAGDVGAGPFIVEEPLSTTLVPPRASLAVHESGSLLITFDGVE